MRLTSNLGLEWVDSLKSHIKGLLTTKEQVSSSSRLLTRLVFSSLDFSSLFPAHALSLDNPPFPSPPLLNSQLQSMKNLLLISIVSSIVCSTSSSSTPISIPAQAISKRRDFPPSPPGATFEQFKPCNSSSRTIPVFVNSAWTTDPLQPSSATHAFIVQHGLGRDFNTCEFLDGKQFFLPSCWPRVPDFFPQLSLTSQI